MKKLIFLLPAVLFLFGCEERKGLDPDKAYEQLTTEQKAEAFELYQNKSVEIEKHKQELDAAHKLDMTANLCIILIVGGVIAAVFGATKIGIAGIIGGAVGLGAVLYWQNAQLLILKYPRTSYGVGIAIIVVLVAGGAYALFNPKKGQAVVREGSLLSKVVSKIKGTKDAVA